MGKKPVVEHLQKHRVDMSLQAEDIAKAGAAVDFRIFSDSTLLGTIEIGQGTFGWKGAKKKTFRRINWTKLAKLLSENL